MARLLYIDPRTGVSGDMLLAALVDCAVTLRVEDGELDPAVGTDRAGGSDVSRAVGYDARPPAPPVPDPEVLLEQVVAGLGFPEVMVQVSVERVGDLRCRRVIVDSAGDRSPLTLADAERILSAARLSVGMGERAGRAIRRLIEVEAGLQGVRAEEVCLHEVDAVEALVEVVGALTLAQALEVGEAVHGPVPLQSPAGGRERPDRGVPSPAAASLLTGRPVVGGHAAGGPTTSTGALLLVELARAWGPLPAMVLEATGYGTSARAADGGPDVVRLVLGRRYRAEAPRQAHFCDGDPGDPDGVAAGVEGDVVEGLGEGLGSAGRGAGRVVELRTTIDDLSAEVLGHLHGLLLSGGALEAWWTPVYMKKARPAVELTVLCGIDDEERLVELVMRESTTFGIRRSLVARHCLDREWVEVSIDGVPVVVKIGKLHGRLMSVSPEYESAARAAGRLGLPLKDVIRDAAAAVTRPAEP